MIATNEAFLLDLMKLGNTKYEIIDIVTHNSCCNKIIIVLSIENVVQYAKLSHVGYPYLSKIL